MLRRLEPESHRAYNFALEPTSDVVADDEDFKAMAGENDLCISMVWRGSMKDCASVMIVSCALAKDFEAVISYEGEPPEPLDAMLQAAREVIEEARAEP